MLLVQVLLYLFIILFIGDLATSLWRLWSKGATPANLMFSFLATVSAFVLSIAAIEKCLAATCYPEPPLQSIDIPGVIETSKPASWAVEFLCSAPYIFLDLAGISMISFFIKLASMYIRLKDIVEELRKEVKNN